MMGGASCGRVSNKIVMAYTRAAVATRHVSGDSDRQHSDQRSSRSSVDFSRPAKAKFHGSTVVVTSS